MASQMRISFLMLLACRCVVAVNNNDIQFLQLHNVPELDGYVLAEPASFGPQFTESGIKNATLVLSEPEEMCEWPPQNKDDLLGKVVVTKRGGCNFIDKVMNAEDSGAIGVVVYAYEDGPPVYMGTTPEHDATEIGIPAAYVALEDGALLLARMKDPTRESEVRVSFETDFETTSDGYHADRQQHRVDFSSLRSGVPRKASPVDASAQTIVMTTAGGEKVSCTQQLNTLVGNRMETALRPLQGSCLFHHDKDERVLYEFCYGKHLRSFDCATVQGDVGECYKQARPYTVGVYAPPQPGHPGAVSALRTHSHLYDMGEECNEDAEMLARGSCVWLGEETDKFKAWEHSCEYFVSEEECSKQDRAAFCRWSPPAVQSNFVWRYSNRSSAMVWFQCAIGGLHELSVVNRTSSCHLSLTVETPLVCSEEGILKQGHGHWSSWECTPQQRLEHIPVVGQWATTTLMHAGDAQAQSGNVTVSEAKPMDIGVGMRGYERTGDYDWPLFLLIWSLPPPAASHATWGIGFFGAQKLFSSLGCALVIYQVQPGSLQGKWSDWTRALSWETAERVGDLRLKPKNITPATQQAPDEVSLVEGIYNFTGGTSVASRKPGKEYSGNLRVERLQVQHVGQPETAQASECQYMLLWWNFEPPGKPVVWSHRGVGCLMNGWLVAGWGSIAAPVGLAHYTFKGSSAIGRGLVAKANEPARAPPTHFLDAASAEGRTTRTVLDSHKLFTSKQKLMHEFEEQWELPAQATDHSVA